MPKSKSNFIIRIIHNSITDENANYITDESNRNISSLSDTISFSAKDLLELSKVYYDGTYSNDNMFLTDSDDQVSAIDEQLKLLDAASEDLYISSHPQYQYTTSLDNFLAKSEYKDYTKNINRGDYLYLTIGNNNVVKLRLIEMTYNPLTMDNNIELTFSNMTRTKNGFSDISYLLDNSSGGSKSSASGSSNNFLNNEGITLTSGLIQKLLSSGAFSNKVSSIINNEFAGMLGSGSISLQELNAKLIKVTDLYGENGYFEYLQSKLISADKIVAGSGNFKDLSAIVAAIDSLLAGNISAELGHLIHLTAPFSSGLYGGRFTIVTPVSVICAKDSDVYSRPISVTKMPGNSCTSHWDLSSGIPNFLHHSVLSVRIFWSRWHKLFVSLFHERT